MVPYKEHNAIDSTPTRLEQRLSHIDMRTIIVLWGLSVRVGVLLEPLEHVIVGTEPSRGTLTRSSQQP